MAKPDKDGWIRHRGGIPKDVPPGQLIEVRYRGEPNEVFRQQFAFITLTGTVWKHYGKGSIMGDSDIMAYKLLEDPL